MSDKYSRKITQSLEDILEEEQGLIEKIQQVRRIANEQVDILAASREVSIFHKESVLSLLRQFLFLFSQVNRSVLEVLENLNLPFSELSIILNEEKSNKVLKKIPNDGHENNDNNLSDEEIELENFKELIESDSNSDCRISSAFESCFSETTERFSVISPTVNPIISLAKLQSSSSKDKITLDYSNEDLDKARENIQFLSKKLVNISLGQEKKSDNSLSCDKNGLNQLTQLTISDENKYKLENRLSPKKSSVQNLSVVESYPDSISSNSSSEYLSTFFNIDERSANKKLYSRKRLDVDEEVRREALADIPDIKLIPVDTKNFSNGISSSESNSSTKSERKYKNKKRNIEIAKLQSPQCGSKCKISHIISLDEFYLQLVDNEETLNYIAKILDKTYGRSTTKFKSKLDALNKLNKFCCGFIFCNGKNSWFRFEILVTKDDDIDSNKSVQVKVFAIDYGIEYSIMYSNLRELPERLINIPVQGIQSHFHALYPPGSTYNNRLTEWNKETVETFYEIANFEPSSSEIVHLTSPTLFEIIFILLEGDSYGVDLSMVEAKISNSIGETFINLGLAVEIIDECHDDENLGAFLEDVKEVEIAENLSERVVGYNATDEARICQFTTKNGVCYKGKNCNLEHILVKDGYTTDKYQVIYYPLNQSIGPKLYEIVKVFVTTYIDICRYKVQFIRNPCTRKDSKFIMNKEMFDLLDVMNHVKYISTYEHLKLLPEIGDIVLAYNPMSAKWLRAKINKYDSNLIYVYSVDIGDEFSVCFDNIRQIKTDLMHVPFQAVEIYLDKFQHKSGCDENKAIKFFNKNIAFQQFFARIQSLEEPYKVTLTTLNNHEIGPILIKRGFVEKREQDVISDYNVYTADF